EPWLIGPCRNFENIKRTHSDYRKGVTVSECLKNCLDEKYSTEAAIALRLQPRACGLPLLNLYRCPIPPNTGRMKLMGSTLGIESHSSHVK
ncbi:hypothetical protein NPIL_196301, partial [Nephila pilipes]